MSVSNKQLEMMNCNLNTIAILFDILCVHVPMKIFCPDASILEGGVAIFIFIPTSFLV